MTEGGSDLADGGADVAEPQTIDRLLAAARARLERLEPTDAQAALAGGALLIDTRAADLRRDSGVIPGAVHVPLSVLYWRLDPTSGSRDPALSEPSRQVIIICAHGYSSSLAAATLLDLGFGRATDVVGGFEAWQAAGLPVSRISTDPAEILIAGARSLARADDLEAGLAGLLGSIAGQFGIGSAAIFVRGQPPEQLDIAATFGLGEPARAALAAAVRDPGHPVARTLAHPEPAFDVLPVAPGGPALRSHLPLIVRRAGVENVVGVLALAHDDSIAPGSRPILEACADLAAIAIRSMGAGH